MKWHALILLVGAVGCGDYAPVTKGRLDAQLGTQEERTTTLIKGLAESVDEIDKQTERNAEVDVALAKSLDGTDKLSRENASRLDNHQQRLDAHDKLGLERLATLFQSNEFEAQVISRGELEARLAERDKDIAGSYVTQSGLKTTLDDYLPKKEIVPLTKQFEEKLESKIERNELYDEEGQPLYGRRSELEELKKASKNSATRFRLYKECREEKGSGYLIQQVRDLHYLDAKAGGPEWYRYRWLEYEPGVPQLQALVCERQFNGRFTEDHWAWVDVAKDGDNIVLPSLPGYEEQIAASRFPDRTFFRHGNIPVCDRPGRKTASSGRAVRGGASFTYEPEKHLRANSTGTYIQYDRRPKARCGPPAGF